ncbi:MAG: 2-oxo acid dehydrogenase subunit E2 [Oscillospiraceae bacterium]|nr:2-oxo acid dehydrogenase subunit E2 [Oscillospiraceae bacterium]
MPKEGITVESCIIGEWKKNVGDAVAVGDVLFTYETDKAEFECPSTAAGTLLAKFFEDGDEVPCLVNVCAVGNPGDAYEFLKPGAEAPAPAAEAPAAEAPAAAAAPAAPKAELTAISPRAMAKAVANNVNPALATGTGPKGRIIERDIDKLIASGAAAAYAAPAAAEETAFEDVKFGPVRKATAKSMTKSLSTMAQLTQQYSFDASQIQAYRAMLKPMDAPMGKISLNDMVMFAVAKTIKSCPDLNANMVEDNVIRHFSHVNLGFACDTPRGLLVPTIFHADEMSLLELSMEAKRLAAAARDGSLSPDEMTGATFTVTNIGSFGCEAFTPVVNPPQIGILGVCNIQTKIKSAKDGMIETYPAMGLSLTFDHRALDGAPAARYMSELCKSLESFMTLMAK